MGWVAFWQQYSDLLWLFQVVCYPHWSCVMWTVMGSLTSSLSSLPWWMLASWVSTAAPFHSSFCMYQYWPLYVCLMDGKSSCHCKSTALLFSEFLKMAGLLCLCFVMLLIIFIASLCSHTCWVNVICFPLSHLGASPSLCLLFVYTWFGGRDKAIRKHCCTNSNWE